MMGICKHGVPLERKVPCTSCSTTLRQKIVDILNSCYVPLEGEGCFKKDYDKVAQEIIRAVVLEKSEAWHKKGWDDCVGRIGRK